MNAPLPFVTTLARALLPGRALDIASGRGRHTEHLARRGWRVTAVDNDELALAVCREFPRVETVFRDVEADGLDPAWEGFHLVLTTFFLHRPLVEHIPGALAVGGRWALETFHEVHRERTGKPGTAAYCLAAGEARQLAEDAGLVVERYAEGEHDGRYTTQMIARRPEPS